MLTSKEKVDLFAEKFWVTRGEAKEQIKAIEEFYASLLTEYQTGFQFGTVGKFEVFEQEERERNNPSTGGKVVVPAHTAFKFKASKGKQSVRTVLKEQ